MHKEDERMKYDKIEIAIREKFAGHSSKDFWKKWKVIKPTIVEYLTKLESEIRLNQQEKDLNDLKNNAVIFQTVIRHIEWDNDTIGSLTNLVLQTPYNNIPSRLHEFGRDKVLFIVRKV